MMLPKMLRPFLRFASSSAVLLALAATSAVRAGDTDVFGLNDSTTYAHGCFDGLCLCPVSITPDVEGTAEIAISLLGGTTIVYDVTNVDWRVGEGDDQITLTGAGTYTRISGFAGWLHRLDLDLSVNGAAPVPFASGLVNGGGDFPNIAIAISNGIDPGTDCVFGTIIEVDASPLPADTVGCKRADFDHDFSIGFADLNALLVNWGACGICPHDLTDDGMVGFADLTGLLERWGACP